MCGDRAGREARPVVITGREARPVVIVGRKARPVAPHPTST